MEGRDEATHVRHARYVNFVPDCQNESLTFVTVYKKQIWMDVYSFLISACICKRASGILRAFYGMGALRTESDFIQLEVANRGLTY